MKSLFKILLLSVSMLLIGVTESDAQSKFKPKGTYAHVYDSSIYQFDGVRWMNQVQESVDSLTTTDSAYNTIKTVYIGANEVGILKISVVGINDSLTAAVTGSKTVRYKKVDGTLTLGTPTSSLDTETDTSLGTATWDVTTSGSSIIVRVKGKLTYTVRWEAHVQKFKKKKLN
jgi:hypothetical protein